MVCCRSALVILLASLIISAATLSVQGPPLPHHHRIDKGPSTSRRNALLVGLASSAGGVVSLVLSSPAATADAALPSPSNPESVDLAAFNAARLVSSGGASSSPIVPQRRGGTIVPSRDPPPFLPIRGGRNGKSTVQIPRVGHSLYKTRPEEASRCVSLALRCGVRHFDAATAYGSDVEVQGALERFLGGSSSSSSGYEDETPELLRVLDDVDAAARSHADRTMGGRRSTYPSIDGSAGRQGRREGLFVSHKLSNDEQSTDVVTTKRRVKNAIARLGVGYLDLVMIHSPLTDVGRRRGTYRALLELRDAGFVRSVGVCNYGIGPLQELRELVGVNNVDDLPAINQLELSPFNTHRDVVRYCDMYGIAIGCSAWSGLSGVSGPAEGWAILSDLAKSRGMTKAQLLVRWSLQKGYVCVPRSGSLSRVERLAIAENSYGGVNPAAMDFVLTDEDIKVLDGLDIGYKAGKLGRRDGWEDGDVVGPDWDPADVV
ncbi:hypothetical protein ACHAW5_004912 [Stephanodiscus triporus]|uniref:NADP-dependent oxidoreductase domain-containing protein n=1 Tax=Stephanodiscus triporus TaxID=2934178 RepID=A0ABD3N8P0_9STRA